MVDWKAIAATRGIVELEIVKCELMSIRRDPGRRVRFVPRPGKAGPETSP